MYATVEDLVGRYGEAEMVRLTTPEGQDRDGVVAERAERSLLAASGLIDSYLRRRYAVPLSPVPPEIEEACCAITRHELSFGSNVAPAEQTRLAYRLKIEWLAALAKGEAELRGVAPVGGDSSGALVSDRPRVFGRGSGCGEFFG